MLGVVPDLLVGDVERCRDQHHRLAIAPDIAIRHLGAEQQMVLELRPPHDPTKSFGFVNSVVSLRDLSSSIWVWHRENGKFGVEKVIEVSAEPAAPEQLPPALQPFGAVPPLITDINLTLDDRFLYVSCWGTGELRQYDVSDPFAPKLTGSVRMGGLVTLFT